jgi:hypothetical protein
MTNISRHLAQRVLSAAELQRALQVSAATMMRHVRAAGPELVRIGRARATRYGWQQMWPGLDQARFPLVRISETGEPLAIGELVTLSGGETVWLPDGAVQRGLPIEIADNRPQGFLGRHFATVRPELRLPDRLDDWSDHHILRAWAHRGEDFPGNLIVGEESFSRWQHLVNPAISRDAYPALANATMAGHPPGSSAGGERPKFGACVEDQHVLVKFAARGDQTDRVARRWSDLLVLEWVALDLLSSRGIAASRATLVESPTHVFLEAQRFDRAGARGRLAVLSLAAVHDDLADSWARAAGRLHALGRLGSDDATRLRWLDAFGALTANTDRHQHNVVLFPAGDRLRLAPAFDPVAMFYAPAADGRVPSGDYVMPNAGADVLDVWADACAAAREFWLRVADDGRVSDDLRAAAGRHGVACA